MTPTLPSCVDSRTQQDFFIQTHAGPSSGLAHLGLGASSPSRYSNCSGPPQSASPGRGDAHSALHTTGSCSSGNAQWLPCRTDPQAYRRQDSKGVRPGKVETPPEGSSPLPCPQEEATVMATKPMSTRSPICHQLSTRFHVLSHIYQVT